MTGGHTALYLTHCLYHEGQSLLCVRKCRLCLQQSGSCSSHSHPPLPQRLFRSSFPLFLLHIKCTRVHTHTVAQLEKEVVDLKQITEKLRKSKKLYMSSTFLYLILESVYVKNSLLGQVHKQNCIDNKQAAAPGTCAQLSLSAPS